MIGLFFRFCLRLRQSSFHWIISDGDKRNRKRSYDFVTNEKPSLRVKSFSSVVCFFFGFYHLSVSPVLFVVVVRQKFKSILPAFLNDLRRLATVSSTFQLLNFDGSVLQIFISYCYNNAIEQMSNHC